MSRKGKKEGNFVLLYLEMKRSPAWQALPDVARRLLDRLEIEHMERGGAENGQLICTHQNFRDYGIHKDKVRLSIKQCIALNFIKVGRYGYSNIRGIRKPNTYYLTYVHGKDGRKVVPPTDEWKKITTPEEAKRLLQRAEIELAKERRDQRTKGISPGNIDSCPGIRTNAQEGASR